MIVRVLGSAAGGGFPQWNCACTNCSAVRAGDPAYSSRTQDSLAVSVDGEEWHVVNASPDIHAQIAANAPLQPRTRRGSPIRSIVLSNGDLDHVLGLFSLRERTPLMVFATASVMTGLRERNAVWKTLERFPGQVTWKRLTLGEPVALDAAGELTVTAHPAAGKLPIHLEGGLPSPEDNVSVLIEEPRTAKRVLYAAATSSVSELEPRTRGTTCAFFDGTFWSADELIVQGLGEARAEEMAHLPVGGGDGSLARIAKMAIPRKIYTHINNSNPMLRAGSAEAELVRAAGVEIATDGMEIVL